MADLGNLLDDINNDDDSIGNNEDQSYEGEENLDSYANARSSSVPSALTAAVARRHKLEDERDETTRSIGEDDDEGEGERILDPDYEQLKSLWTNEIASPELMHNDDEIVSIHVDVLEGQEETVDDLFQRSKQQRQSRDGGHRGS